ncbi:MAG TPA: hypothetical protein VGJ70_06255 [Solirubrobacteraceae bacterium]
MLARVLCVLTPLAALVAAPVADAHHGPFTHGVDAIGAFSTATSPGPRAELNTPWCGDELTADDTADQVDNGPYRYHAILAEPAGAPDRLDSLASGIQADALGASAVLEQRYRRAIRFDLGTTCGPDFLDISVLHMHRDSATLRREATETNGTLNAVYDELAAAGFPVTSPDTAEAPLRAVNYVVWLDGPAPAGACGQATLYDDPRRIESNRNNMGGSVALLFRTEGGFCGPDAVRHEIGHTLGAVQPRAAPHADDTGHCTDALEDTLCLNSAPSRTSSATQSQFFDYGNDDYWDPPDGAALPWWTANLSRFLCWEAGCNGVRTLAVPRAVVARHARAHRRRHRRARRSRSRRPARARARRSPARAT